MNIEPFVAFWNICTAHYAVTLSILSAIVGAIVINSRG